MHSASHRRCEDDPQRRPMRVCPECKTTLRAVTVQAEPYGHQGTMWLCLECPYTNTEP